MWKSERAGCDLRQHPMWICVCLISENGREIFKAAAATAESSSTRASQPTIQPASQNKQLLVLLLLFWYSLSLSLSANKIHACIVCVCLVGFFLFHVKDNRILYEAISHKAPIPSAHSIPSQILTRLLTHTRELNFDAKFSAACYVSDSFSRSRGYMYIFSRFSSPVWELIPF